jgi:TPR repeat protein
MYFNGQGVEKNFFKANELFTISCNNGVGLSCFNLGNSYYNGQGIKQDIEKAKEFYGKACDLEYERGCKNYAFLNKK